MFWALEMSDSGYGQYLWRRLMVIAVEDVGLADPQALTLTVSGWLSTKECTKSFTQAPGMKTEFLGMVILYLCRAPKNREGDDFCWYVMERRQAGGFRSPISR
jgi:replication-associated recombination protein RarA